MNNFINGDLVNKSKTQQYFNSKIQLIIKALNLNIIINFKINKIYYKNFFFLKVIVKLLRIYIIKYFLKFNVYILKAINK